ncbi:hypothetical protein V5F77_03470 [Xanthobacter sp. DSM 24535]|uniref:hypothetical protein n=1 Tax=Roseixanthobacter psychrophilus TaxID=3119917 RepID=UPI003726C53A
MRMIARALLIVCMMVTLVSASAFVVLPELNTPAPKQPYYGPSAFAALIVPPVPLG